MINKSTRLLLLVSIVALLTPAAVLANGRIDTHDTPYVEYTWYVVRYVDNAIICRLFLDEPGQPTYHDVATICGDTIALEWLETPACPSHDSGPPGPSCNGVYIHYVRQMERIDHEIVKLDITIDVSIQGDQIIIDATDPLDDEHITRIEALINDTPVVCDDKNEIPCIIPIYPTPAEGKTLTAWATSSNGDVSERMTGLVKNHGGELRLIWGQSDDVGERAWIAFRPTTLPGWLSDDLHTERRLSYLAGRLIAAGHARAGDCPNYGLLSNGWASECGIDAIWPDLVAWQNKYNDQIRQAADETGVPAIVLKAALLQETQLWPDATAAAGESGLGQITLNGADTLLRMDRDFYRQYVRNFYPDDAREYINLDPWQRSNLQHAVLRAAETTGGVELSARLLAANAHLVGQILRDRSGDQRPGALMSYADLWRLTLLGYNAGSGCVRDTLRETAANGHKYDWGAISPYADAICNGAASNYVNKITR